MLFRQIENIWNLNNLNAKLLDYEKHTWCVKVGKKKASNIKFFIFIADNLIQDSIQ